MELSDSQIASVQSWIREGKSIADVQRGLREEFDISMTYMDVRFLVDDLDIVFEEPEAVATEDPSVDSTDTSEEPEVVDATLVSGVSVDVDPVTPPGALVCGSVTFSDGEKLGWQLSAAGQLGLVPGDNPEYRPSPEDVQEFQTKLQEVLQKHGY